MNVDEGKIHIYMYMFLSADERFLHGKILVSRDCLILIMDYVNVGYGIFFFE